MGRTPLEDRTRSQWPEIPCTQVISFGDDPTLGMSSTKERSSAASKAVTEVSEESNCGVRGEARIQP